MPVFAQMDRNGREHAPPACFQRIVEFAHDRFEFGHFGGPHIGLHEFGQGVIRRQVAPDMPELLQVEDGSVLRLFLPERRVAARATDPCDLVGAFGFLGQREECAAGLLGARDQIVGYAVIADDAIEGWGREGRGCGYDL